MNLHKNSKDFLDTLLAIGDKLSISPAIIEKDYYVTVFLESLIKRVPEVIFKGGTSLSKCYKIINRFSEDIDLTLSDYASTKLNRKRLKSHIIEVCKELGFEIINIEKTKSRRNYNCYEIKYPTTFFENSIKQFLLVETVFMIKSYPSEVKEATSIIYEFWEENKRIDLITEYDMKKINIQVQTIERTLIDKVFAICDYVISNQLNGNSRHIYDIYKLIGLVELNEEIRKLVKEVKEERKKFKYCYSAQEYYNIPNILKHIIEDRVYFEDYELITKKVLFEEVSYEEAIAALNLIIESGIFE